MQKMAEASSEALIFESAPWLGVGLGLGLGLGLVGGAHLRVGTLVSRDSIVGAGLGRVGIVSTIAVVSVV